MSYKEILKERIPEAFQDDEQLLRYLETAGELFDEYVKTIEGFDHYRDFTGNDLKRLRQLAIDFGMLFPRNLNEETQRRIIRDIHDIYSRVGVKRFTDWVFRIIGWDITIEHAWLPNPDLYDPSIADIHNLDQYGRSTDLTITNFYEADYRAFYIGESYVAPDGNVYFSGRKFFDKENTIDQLEIVGEDYDVLTKYRTSDKMGATPYVFVRVEEENYSNFLTSYVYQETGEVFKYNRVEQFAVIENILNYYVFDQFRPTNVRVVIIVKTETVEDQTTIYDDVSTEYKSKPLILEDDTVMTLEETSRLDHKMRVGKFFMSGTPPHPFGKRMSIAPLNTDKLIKSALNVDENTVLRYADSINNDTEKKRYRIDRPMDFQPTPLAGTEEFTFYTPDREQYSFRLIFNTVEDFLSAHTEAGTFDAVYSFPYTDDLDTLRLNFDFKTTTYGIVDGLPPPSIIIREPTDVTSPNFTPSSIPNREFMVGQTSDDGETFSDDYLMKSSFENDSYEAIDEALTITYFYDMEVLTKENNRSQSFTYLMDNPSEGDLMGLVDWNTILFVPKIPLGFDLVIDVKYLEQPVWENDPRLS